MELLKGAINMKKKKMQLQENFYQEYQNALENLRIAESNFKNVIPEFFDLANAELTVAWLRVDTMKKNLRKLVDTTTILM